MDSVWLVAATWVGLALAASVISLRLGVSVALVELLVGFLGGNALGLQPNDWVNVLAGLGAILLTFLAGAEIDPEALRKHLKPSVAIGGASFLAPFLGAWAFAQLVLGWTPPAAQIAGVAMSTTSVAVVYAVMIETGLNRTDLGKLILAGCFVTDLGTVLALGLLFARYDLWLVAFVVVSGLVLWKIVPATRWVLAAWGGRIAEIEIKFLLFVLLALGALASAAKSEAVLPAYVLGLAIAGVFARDRVLIERMRTLAFALLTPFFFLKAGALVQAHAVLGSALLIVAFLAVKMVTKLIGVWPLARAFRLSRRHANYTTLLMSTGLTFGSIAALFGLNHGIIDQAQYTVLVTAVIGSALLPTLIAQAWFYPHEAHASARRVERPASEFVAAEAQGAGNVE